jgi:predicted nucleic acid-binding protein
MIVIADTSAINYLILIGEAELLRDLYRGVILPPAVRRELLASNSPEAVRNWISNSPDWIRLAVPGVEALARTDKTLDIGEREAIALALDLHAALLLIDDAQGRREAERQNLAFTGTLGVLLAASEKGLLNLDDAIGKLRRTSFFVSEKILRRILRGE